MAGESLDAGVTFIVFDASFPKNPSNIHTVWVKKYPPFEVFWHFPQTAGNFFSSFYTPIVLSYLR